MREHEQEIRERFKDHKATLKEGVLTWSKGGSDDQIHYTIMPDHLCVSGDLECAVYCVYNNNLCFESFSKFDIGYFSGKCHASHYASGFKVFNQELAQEELRKQLNRAFEEFEGEIEDDDEEEEDKDKDKLEEWKQAREELEEFEHQHELNQLLLEHGENLLGQDHWESSQHLGMKIHYKCYMHLYGLQMAVEYLRAAKGKEAVTS